MSQPLACPMCGVPVAVDEATYPFCSKRCRTSDLAKWASGDYKVSRPLTPEERLAAERAAAGLPADDDEDD